MMACDEEDGLFDLGEEDRLSDLCDDLLLYILRFVPFKEAASTSALSRRWGSLWESSGAVNLTVRACGRANTVLEKTRREMEEAFSSRRDAFVGAAQAALTAAGASCRVTRLTFRLDITGCLEATLPITTFLNYGETDLVDALLSHPAARRVEELSVALGDYSPWHSSAEPEASWDRRVYGFGVSLASLPFETLRVLDITGCDLRALPDTAAFPRLETLQLQVCVLQLDDMQRLIDAAPGLTTVHLASVVFSTENEAGLGSTVLHLRCPAATALVLASCRLNQRYSLGLNFEEIRIDAPKLRSFRYKGVARPFFMESPAPEMTTVNLHFVRECRSSPNDEARRVNLWRFIRSFTTAKTLELKVRELDQIALTDKASQDELLTTFPNLERLELVAVERPVTDKETAAAAIANLLCCCPAVRDLTLKLCTNMADRDFEHYQGKFLRDFDKSINLFARLKSKPTSIDTSHGDDKAGDIHALSRQSFTCLQSRLEKVKLKCRIDQSKSSCFGVDLIRFFAQNAILLKEIHVDVGNRKLSEHTNLQIETWVGAQEPSSNIFLKCKNLKEGSYEFSRIHTVGSFIVSPFRR